MYGLIDKSVFEVILRTCKSTEIPPKPSKNDAKIILIDIALIFILEINEMPFVISSMPVSKGVVKSEGICKNEKHGIKKVDNIFARWLTLNIDIITENITTNPPIIKIVDVADVMLSAIAPPRLENVTFEVFLEVLGMVLIKFLFEFTFDEFFQNLNIIPTVIHASKCVENSKKPIVEFPNILIPTVPIMNKGPELFVKLSNLSHSTLLKTLFFLKFVAIFAPTGYPLIIPMINANEPSPRILNNGFINILHSLPNI